MTGKPSRKRKSKPKKKAPRKRIPAWVVGALVAVGALGLAWQLGLRPELHTPPSEKPAPPPPKPELTAAALQDSLEGALEALGVDPRRIRKRTAEETSRRWEWSLDLPATLSLVRTNLALTEAVERWGGRVWEATEFTSVRTGGTALRMALGGRASVFGWLVLEGSAQPHTAEREAPRVAVVIDDFGYALDGVVQSFIDFPYEITLAVLPGVPYSRQVAERAFEAGKHTILHLPMEPHGYPRDNPGPGAILIEMDEDKILEIFDEDLGFVPGADGFSNHMGSAATEDPVVMRIVLREASRRGLFFFDSLTSSRSVGSRVAAECGVPCLANDLFIDNQPEDLESIRTMVRRLGRIAEARGWAVGIGHPRAATLEVLRDVLPELEASGIKIVPVAELAALRVAGRCPGGGASAAK